VIVSFGDATTEDLFHGVTNARTRQLPTDVVTRARRRLDRLNAAAVVTDMKMPPSNSLEKLKGDLAGFWSVRVNDQYRIIFRWTDAGPAEVRFTDYH
jgi:proteic killer suppression protein